MKLMRKIKKAFRTYGPHDMSGRRRIEWAMVTKEAKGAVLPVSGFQIIGGKKWTISFMITDEDKAQKEEHWRGE